jgi:hypothetical protein
VDFISEVVDSVALLDEGYGTESLLVVHDVLDLVFIVFGGFVGCDCQHLIRDFLAVAVPLVFRLTLVLPLALKLCAFFLDILFAEVMPWPQHQALVEDGDSLKNEGRVVAILPTNFLQSSVDVLPLGEVAALLHS